MTATTHPSRPIDRFARRPVEANYGARRAVAALVVLVVVVFLAIAASAMVGALVDIGGRPAAASDVATAATGAPIVRVHVAQAGDTLWSIADSYRGDVGRDRFVEALIDLNAGTAIQVGQAVRLP